ncbi:hypothetical protein R2325_16395 [Mycobacteroides chelonae]|uniref:hypothetical protein n=1 Tax=Mycobacteroides chelonae TaxID=1774 RepID=UPI002DEBE116|nr:hypothetical protein [Mycobacteroides chelonae]MEC4873565.1 hypothetical protein [Mycobacteroides chelonae]
MADSSDQLATAAELGTWLGESLDSSEIPRAEFILRVVSGWARQIAGKLWPDRDAPDFPFTVKGIVLASARREFENPRHVVYEVKGPESASYNQQAYPPGFFTAPEEKFLQRFRPGGGLRTQSTYRDDEDFVIGYVRVLGQNKPIPYFNPWDPGWMESEHL